MATISPILLSGSASGKQIKVVATSTPGTAIHTAVSGSTSFDEVWLWGTNSSAATVKVTIEFGGVASPDDQIEASIPPESGPFLIVPGLKLNGGLLIKAFAGTANVVLISGYVNQYVP